MPISFAEKHRALCESLCALCGKKDAVGDGTDYSGYARYADQELFCRWKQGFAPLGDVSKDWSFRGTQYPDVNGNGE